MSRGGPEFGKGMYLIDSGETETAVIARKTPPRSAVYVRCQRKIDFPSSINQILP